MSSSLSIIIPTIAFSERLKRSVKSALKVCPNAEIIVLDNSVRGLRHKLRDEIKSGVVIVRNKRQLLMADNWSHSIQLASRKYFLMLHDDDYLDSASDFSFVKEEVDEDLFVLAANVKHGGTLQGLAHYNDDESRLSQKEFYLEKFPGVQRQVWKTSTIKETRFLKKHGPVFDYIWFAKLIWRDITVSSTNLATVVIESHPGQHTNNIVWSPKVFLVFLMQIFLVENYRHGRLSAAFFRHLISRFLKSLHLDYRNVIG